MGKKLTKYLSGGLT